MSGSEPPPADPQPRHVELLIELDESFRGGRRALLRTRGTFAIHGRAEFRWAHEDGSEEPLEPLGDWDPERFAIAAAGAPLRQSFPAFARRLFRADPRAVRPGLRTRSSLDLFLRVRLLERPRDGFVQSLRERPFVRRVMRIPAVSSRPPTLPDPLETNLQGYLDAGFGGGVDAYYAWAVGAAGSSLDAAGAPLPLRVCVVDRSVDTGHEDFPASFDTLAAIPNDYDDIRRHGTKVVTLLGAPRNGVGITGMCHEAKILFSPITGSASVAGGRILSLSDAIDRALAEPTLLGAGDVLLLEAQLDPTLWSDTIVGVDPWAVAPAMLPVEVAPDIRDALIRAAESGVTVVEAAGNGNGLLARIDDADPTREPIWDPELHDSLAIVVGGGHPPTSDQAHAWVEGTNWGPRVDCRGWGDGVGAASCPPSDGYVGNFGGTSAASAMIAGVVACLQSAAHRHTGAFLDPITVRQLLRDEASGTPQADGAVWAAHERKVGPLPDLGKLLSIHPEVGLALAPDLFLRDHEGDSGETSETAKLRYESPDVVVSEQLLPAAFGSATWSREIWPGVVAGKPRVLARISNRGAAPDSGIVRMWWAEPGPFVPRWAWRRLGKTEVHDVAPGHPATASIAWPDGERPSMGHAALVVAVSGERDPWAPPEASAPTESVLELLRRRNDLRIRNRHVVRVRGAADVAACPLHLRGIGESTAPCVLSLKSYAPPGTKLLFRVSSPLERLVPGQGGYPTRIPLGDRFETEASSLRLNGVVLEARAEVRGKLEVKLPANARPGVYRVTVDQFLGVEGPEIHLGRQTIDVALAVPPPFPA